MTRPDPHAEVRLPVANPFATRFTQPGALPYLFGSGESAALLAERFEQLGRCAAIVGPHGVGKSTLLAAILAELTRRGQQVVAVSLHEGERRLPLDLHSIKPIEPIEPIESADGPLVLAIDGYEQLSIWSRWQVGRFARRRSAGLLVTMHRAMRLSPCARSSCWWPWAHWPLLAQLAPSLQQAEGVVAALLAQHTPTQHAPAPDSPAHSTAPQPVEPLIGPADVAAAFEQTAGNIRETLFRLYDLYELRRRR